MDAVEKANADRQKRWYALVSTCSCGCSRSRRAKDQKIGEGTYAVVYKGACHARRVENDGASLCRKGDFYGAQGRYQED